LEDRVKSRFLAGMIVDIPAPDKESRAAILRHKAKNVNFQLQDDVIDYLSLAIEGNIRELEGVLNSVVCQAGLKGRDLSLNEIKALVKTHEKPKKSVSIKEVVKAVANFYDIEEEMIYEKTRRKEVVKPRQITMYLLREDYSVSYPLIGQKLGGRDHTTVIHSYEKIKNDLKNNNVLAQDLNQIRLLI
jgi:chromosomal replication initiator protein